MSKFKINLLSNFVNLTIGNKFYIILIIVYELTPIIIQAAEPSGYSKNYLNEILKYFSMIYQIEMINTKFENNCPFYNLTYNSTQINMSSFSPKYEFISNKNMKFFLNFSVQPGYCLININIMIFFFIRYEFQKLVFQKEVILEIGCQIQKMINVG